ncbi:hypothetical protein [Parapedobacter defluvii]|uniref:hypothetical protein n=1 Tax=Parapedobacter defluvii TaxID=2045106 RepID=UPI00166CC147|nr:hypothetical protein [Parapedobacter defluvii]
MQSSCSQGAKNSQQTAGTVQAAGYVMRSSHAAVRQQVRSQPEDQTDHPRSLQTITPPDCFGNMEYGVFPQSDETLKAS